MKKLNEFIAEAMLEEEFGHPDQKTMHKVLRSHGWVTAKKAEYKTNAALKGEHLSDKIKSYASFRGADSMIAHAKQVRHYTHPDRPHESIQTSPASSVYNVWTHYQGHLPGKERNGFQYLGGKRGKSGKAVDLDRHLTSYKKRPERF